jgi:hypothetical protein
MYPGWIAPNVPRIVANVPRIVAEHRRRTSGCQAVAANTAEVKAVHNEKMEWVPLRAIPGQLAGLLVNWLVCWSTGRSAGQLAGLLVNWLVWWSTGRSAGPSVVPARGQEAVSNPISNLRSDLQSSIHCEAEAEWDSVADQLEAGSSTGGGHGGNGRSIRSMIMMISVCGQWPTWVRPLRGAGRRYIQPDASLRSKPRTSASEVSSNPCVLFFLLVFLSNNCATQLTKMGPWQVRCLTLLRGRPYPIGPNGLILVIIIRKSDAATCTGECVTPLTKAELW